MQKSRKVILMMETSRTYGRSILRGIAKYSDANGPWIFYKNAPFYRGTGGIKATLNRLLKLDTDGMVLRDQHKRKRTEEILAMGEPAVVSQIASKLGYLNAKNLARYFKKAKE